MKGTSPSRSEIAEAVFGKEFQDGVAILINVRSALLGAKALGVGKANVNFHLTLRPLHLHDTRS